MLKQVKSLYDNSAPIDLKDSQRQYLVCAIGEALEGLKLPRQAAKA